MKTQKLRMALTAQQGATLIGLETLVHAAGLILVCPRCLAEGNARLDTDNQPHAPEWKVDCGCLERRIGRRDVGATPDADGALIAQADQILAPVSLAVRCPAPRCIATPLQIDRRGGVTVIRCHCAKTTLRPPTIH